MLQTAISVTVHWAIVPGIMLALFLFGRTILARNTSDADLKTSASAGFWAGLVLLVIFVVSQLHKIRTPTFDVTELPGLDPAPTGVGFVLGFAFLWAARYMAPTRLVGLIVLLLTATSSISLYAYIFIESLRSMVLFLALGTALGALLHMVFFPGSVRQIWGES